jgi:hypothetical protein
LLAQFKRLLRTESVKTEKDGIHWSMRYDSFRKELVAAVVDSPGETAPELRRTALQHRSIPGPPPLASYVDKVWRHAYKVTDADVAGLKQAGHSDDSLFEITVAAAVGAALYRLERGMAALRGEEPD